MIVLHRTRGSCLGGRVARLRPDDDEAPPQPGEPGLGSLAGAAVMTCLGVSVSQSWERCIGLSRVGQRGLPRPPRMADGSAHANAKQAPMIAGGLNQIKQIERA